MRLPVFHRWPDGRREVEPYGGQWMPWADRPSREEIVAEAIALMRADFAQLTATPKSEESRHGR